MTAADMLGSRAMLPKAGEPTMFPRRRRVRRRGGRGRVEMEGWRMRRRFASGARGSRVDMRSRPIGRDV